MLKDILVVITYTSGSVTIGKDITSAVDRNSFSCFSRKRAAGRNGDRFYNWFTSRYNSSGSARLLDVVTQDSPGDSHAQHADEEKTLALVASAIRERETYVYLSREQASELLVRGEPRGTYDAHLHCIAMEGSGRIIPTSLRQFVPGTGRFAGRFGLIQHGNTPEGRNDNGRATIDAELRYSDVSGRTGNVSTAEPRGGFELIFGVYPSGASFVRPEEVHIVDVDGELRFWSERLSCFIRVNQSNMLNVRRSRIARIIAEISEADRALYLPWGKCASLLPFVPGARLEDCDVAMLEPQWNVPVAIAAMFDTMEGRSWIEQWSVPRFVYLADGDRRLLLDLNNRIGSAEVVRASLRATSTVKLEALPFSEGIAAEQSIAFPCELVLGVAQTDNEHSELSAPELQSQQDTFILGSEWTYVKAYRESIGSGRGFARQVLSAVIDLSRRCDDFHFLHYADPDRHLRMRFRGAVGSKMLPELFERMSMLCSKGIVERVEYATYVRESQRYGGAKNIERIERLFTIDSFETYDKIIAQSDLEHGNLLSACRFIAELIGSFDEALRHMQSSHGRREKLDKDSWARIAVVKRALFDEPKLDARKSEIITSCTLAVTDRPRVLSSLIHMHCNRLGLSRSEEIEILRESTAVFEGLVAMRPKRLETA